VTKTTNSLERDPGLSRRQLMMAGASIATLGVIATWFYGRSRPEPTDTALKVPRAKVHKLSLSELPKPGPMPEMVLGKEDAPVTIYEYADLTCPACAHFQTVVLPQVKAKYIDTGKAKLVFREFPNNTPAVVAFMTVRCVEPENAHPLISALFAHQEDWRGSRTMDELRTKLYSYAQQVGLTKEAFDACVPTGGSTQLTAKQQKLFTDISSVRERGHDGFGVSATPTFFVNGKKFTGGSMEDFDQAMAANP
jgi:protein-disulfide isomerase